MENKKQKQFENDVRSNATKAAELQARWNSDVILITYINQTNGSRMGGLFCEKIKSVCKA